MYLLVLGVLFSTLTCQPGTTSSANLAQRLYNLYNDYQYGSITHRRFSPEQIQEIILELKAPFVVQDEGYSVEGRPIRSVRIGSGKTKVLLWSQMHGDEATATMALLDIFRFFQGSGDGFDQVRTRLLEELSIVFVPLLNPDGAARFQRRNALGLDVNRDALMLTSPEAQILKQLHAQIDPDWGFNLHDQGRFYGVSGTSNAAALAFLAPAYNQERGVDPKRQAAMQLIGGIYMDIKSFVEGHVAKYNDAFEPRAFGDNFQKWGTRTILVESGFIQGDPERQRLRRLNFVLLLCALDRIATESWQSVSRKEYEQIPFNARNAFFDLMLRNTQVKDQSGKWRRLDFGFRNVDLDWDSKIGTVYRGRVGDIGDLSLAYGHQDLDASDYSAQTGKVYPRTFQNLDQLLSSNPVQLIQEGYSFFQVRAFPSSEIQLRLPFELVASSVEPVLNIQLGSNPTFFLCNQQGGCRYYVRNGRLFDLQTEMEALRRLLP